MAGGYRQAHREKPRGRDFVLPGHRSMCTVQINLIWAD